MNHPLISLIVPVFNASPYLEECLDSISKQDYQDFEVILVDDGSTDGSGEMCDRKAAADPRFRVLHCPNGGSSVARNAGVGIAWGEFVAFADSDDIIHPSYLSRLHGLMRDEADISMVHFSEGDVITPDVFMISKKQPVVMNGLEAMERTLYQRGMDTSPCCKLYRRHLFEIERFRPGILYEDLEFVVKVMSHVRSVVVGDDRLYFYRKHAGSNIGSFSFKRLDVLDVTKGLRNFVSEKYPALADAADDRRLSAAFNMFIMLSANGYGNGKEARQCWAVMKGLRKKSLINPKVRLKNKLGILLSYTGRRVFRLISSVIS